MWNIPASNKAIKVIEVLKSVLVVGDTYNGYISDRYVVIVDINVLIVGNGR